MADVKENENMEERAREKSFNKSPVAINKVTLAMIAFFIVVIILGGLLIGGFFTLGTESLDNGANASRANP